MDFQLNLKHPRFSCLAAFGAMFLACTTLAGTADASEFGPSIDLSSLNGTTGFRLNGIGFGDFSGGSVASAGDVNGDGYADLIIGAKLANSNGQLDAGESYVVFGKAGSFGASIDLSVLDGTNGFRLGGIGFDDQSGTSVSSAGDVNGDGFDDVIVGAPYRDPNGNSAAGESYVVFGKAGGFAATFDLSSLNGSTGFALSGINANDLSGGSVASAGDVNGDGFADIIIGARGGDIGSHLDAGESYVLFGKSSGFAPTINLSTLDGSNGFIINGIVDRDYSGRSVASAGDVNGDGFDDIVIGAVGADPNGQSYAGESYVVFGKAGGFEQALDLSTLDGSTGFRLTGIDSYDRSGLSVASAGDVNGDGFSDLIIGAIGGDPNGKKNAGESYVVFGKAVGFASTIDLSALNGSDGFRLDGIAANDISGTSVASAGDVNGDGYADLIVGSLSNPNDLPDAGESYVIFGRSSGFSSAIELSALDGVSGFRLVGIDAGDFSGQSVAMAGDVNGDGFSDVLVGARKGDPNGKSNAGESYVIFGRPPNSSVTRIGSTASQYISGGSFVDSLVGGEGDDILEGRFSGDLLDGGLGNDTASYAHSHGNVTASLGFPALNTGEALGDSYVSIENMVGSKFFDRLAGNHLANRIFGGNGGDLLQGGQGDDTLVGGLGVDILGGGTGRDTFKYTSTADSPSVVLRDRISDFEAGTSNTSVDLIDISAIDANPAIPGDQAFTYIGNSKFSGTAGELRISLASSLANSFAVVSGDVNGDKQPDFQICLLRFTSILNIDSGDFIK